MRFLRQTLLSVCLILACAIAWAQPSTFNDAADGKGTNIIFQVLGNDLGGTSAVDPASTSGIDPLNAVANENFELNAATPVLHPLDDDPPTIDPILDQMTIEDVAIIDLPFTIDDPDGFGATTLTGTSDLDAIIPDGNITFGGSGPNRTVTITPLLNQNGGPVAITIEVGDGLSTASTTFDVTVTPDDDPPTIGTISNQTTSEDVAITGLPFTIGDPDGFGTTTLTGISNDDAIIPDGNITFGGSGTNRTVSITPLLNQNGGPVEITVEVGDGTATASTTFDVMVTPSDDDPPTIGTISNQTTSEDVAIIGLPFTIGDPDGFGTTTLTGISNDDAIIPDGNITFGGSGTNRTVSITPLLNQNGGPVEITVEVGDGTATASRTFDVMVTPSDDPPTIGTISNQTTSEDIAIIGVPFTIGDPDGFGTTTLTGLSNNDTIVPDGNITFGGSGASRTVTITPAPNQTGGPVAITVEVGDGSATASTSFDVTVSSADDDPPTIDPIGDQTVTEDGVISALPFTIGDPDGFIGITLTGLSNNDAIIPDGNITFGGSGANRTVTITPLLDQNGGPVVITIEVNDGTTTVTRNFNVTVTASPDPPTIGAIGNQTVAEDAVINALPFTIGDPDGFTGITLTGLSNNDAIIPDGNITFGGSGANRTVTITPLLDQNGGPVVITIEVNDGTTTVSRNFNVTVTASPDPPTIGAIGNQTVAEDAVISALPFTIGDPDGFTGITLTGLSNNDLIIPDGNITFGGSGANRTVTITPLLDQSGGPVVITIQVNDGTTTVSRNFNVTVTPSNDPPTIGAIANQSVAEDAVINALAFTIGDPDGFTGITLTGLSNNDLIIPDGNITFGGSGANRTVTITPLLDQNGGPVVITIEVNDGTTTVSRNFNVTVTASPDPPTIGAIGNQTVAEDAVISALPFTIGDPDGFTGITLTGLSNNDAIIPDGNITFGGSGANRTVTITPLPDQSGGPVVITIQVNDGTTTVSRNFNVTVTPSNDPPTIGAIANQSVAEDAVINALAFTIGDPDGFTGITLTGLSNNDAIIPDGNITFGGSGANRTVTITPLPDQNGGPVVITIEVNDGTTTVSRNFNVTVTASPDPPTIGAIGNQTVAEDAVISALPFTIGDPDGFTGITLTGLSNNDAIIPDGNITFGGSGANRTVTITPLPDQSGGPVVITIEVNDGTTTVTRNFNVTVTPLNDPPTIGAIANQSVAEDAVISALAFTIGDPDGFTGITLTGLSNNDAIIPDGNITFGGSGANRTVTITPLPDQNGGPVVITIEVNDGTTTVSRNFNVTVTPSNDPPTIAAISNQTTAEDVVILNLPFTIGDPDGFTGITLTGSSDNDAIIPDGNITFGGSGANRTVTITPLLNQSGGPVVITIQVGDGTATASTNFNVTVTPTNDPPTIATISNQTINEDGTINALPFTIGDVDNPVASLTVSGLSNNDAIIPDANITFGGSGASRTVTITPLPNQSGGPVTITITASDGTNSGTTNFSVTLTPVNDPPTITPIGNQAIAEDTPTAALAFTIGDIDTPVGSLTVTGSSNATTVIPNANIVITGTGASRTVTLTPAPEQSGLAVITLTVSDGTTNVPMSFAVTVNPVSDPPTITAIPNQLIDEDSNTGALPFIIGDIDNPAGTLALAAGSSNLTLVPVANIVFGGSGANRTVTVTPAADQTGVAIITITVGDGTTAVPTSFQVTVDGFNDPPTISAIANQSTSEDVPTAAIPFTVGDPETPAADLTVTATSDNVGIIPNANIIIAGSGANRTVQVTPEPNQSGAAIITLTVSDGVNSTPISFQVTVNTVDDAPTITAIPNQTIAEDTQTTALAFTINDVETPLPSLTVTASSGNVALVPLANIVLAGSGANHTIQVTPLPNQFGTAVITVTVNDGTNTTSTTFQVNVTSVNDAPTITAITDRTVNEDISTGALSFTITDAETPVASLTVTGSSDNTTLVPVANMVFGGSGGTRTVTVTPAANQTGVAILTITVNDGTANVSTTFQLTVNPVNDAPVITGQTLVSTAEEQPLDIELSHITVTDVDDIFPTDFTLTVLTNPGYTVLGNTITPNTNVTGNIVVRVRVNDGALNSNIYNLQVTVNPINDPPVITGQSTLTILEDTPLTFLLSHLTIVDPDNASGFTFVLAPGSNYSVSGGNLITPAAHFNGTLSIPVTVSDGTNASAPYNLQIQVTPVNDKPQITGQTPISIAEVQPVTLDLSQLTVFDPDNNFPADFVLTISTGPNYSAVGNVVTPVVNFSGTLLVRIKVSDGSLESDYYDFQILVNSTNDPPVITGQRPLNTEENEPLQIQFVDLTVTDPDNTYPTGFTLTILPGTTYTFSGTTVTPNVNVSGLIDVRVKVNDGAVDSAPYLLKIDVNSVNDAPVITGQLPMTALEDAPVINMSLGFLIISDPDSPISGFTMTVSPGTHYTLANGVEITPEANFSGTLSVPVKVNDGSLDSQPYNVQIQITPVNDAPTITGQNPLSAVEDQGIILKLEDFLVADIDNTFPTGFTLQVAQGSFPNYDAVGTTVTPKDNFTGTLGVAVTVSDGAATSGTYSAAIFVGTINDPPTIDPIANITIQEDPVEPSVISLTGITAGVGEGGTQLVTVTISTDHPDWFEVFEVTYPGSTLGTLRIKPIADQTGTAQVTVRIQDDGLATPPHVNFFEYTFDFTIDAVNDPPIFTSQPKKLAETAQGFEYLVEVDDVEKAAITITAPTLPTWLILTQGSNGQATLSGIPPLGTTGEVSVVIVATDPLGSLSTQEFKIVVNARPTITPFAINTDEDKDYRFVSEFASNYNDPDGNPIVEIQIKQLPTKGQLLLNDVLVSLNAVIPKAQIERLIYRPSEDTNGTDIMKWNASDGVYYSAFDANIVVSIIPFNDPPEIIALELPETDTLKYELGSEVPIKLTNIFDARDPEGDNIIAAEIGFQISTDYQGDHDIFSFRDTLGIVGAFIEELGVLTLTGKASVQDYVAAIRTVRYNYLDAEPDDDGLKRKVSIRLNDGNFGGTKERLIGLIYTNPGLDIANAFTPNGDDDNKYWRIYSPAGLERYKDALIRVYDKRGALVYQATGFSTPWYGEGPEGVLPADSYYYTIDLRYDKKKYKGVVTILR